jgi:hypothetical protein
MIAWEERMDQQQLWVEPSGGIILARIRGVPAEPLLRACQWPARSFVPARLLV